MMTVTERARNYWFHLRHMPDDGAGKTSGGAAAKPAVRGVTMAARAAAAKEEQPLSEENASIIPGIGDILAEMSPEVRTAVKSEAEAEAEEAEDEEEAGTEEAEAAPGEEEEAGAETGEEEAAAEAETTGEEAPDEDAELKTLPKEVQESINKRIGKITGEKKKAQEELVKAQTRIAELEANGAAQPVRMQPTPENPLAHVQTADELREAVTTAQRIEDWCLRNPDGAEVAIDDKGGTRAVEKAEIANHLANARRTLNAVQGRAEYLKTQQQAEAIAKAVYPKMYTPGTEEHQTFTQIKRALPGLQQFADWPLYIADAMAGKAARETAASRAAAALKPGPGKVHGGPAARVAPKKPAKEVRERISSEQVSKGLGDKKSLESFAEGLVGV